MESPVVEISEGKLEGSIRKNLDGKPFLSFLGIPYAKPPVGNLRFKSPQPAEPWNGLRDATKEGDCCYQTQYLSGKAEGSEDCLHLNVFTKQLPAENSRMNPVMVFIHGGGFMYGSNKLIISDPAYLLTENIVLVVINYRLGFLGFLSLEDPSLEIPGNAGMKDQVLALKWVQKNIKYFGGDPNNVTIFGESAGSASVHYHILSESSKGLFHKAIMQSGVIFLNLWGVAEDHHAVEFVKFMVKEANNEKEALEVLNNMGVDELFRNQIKYTSGRVGIVAPVIEKANSSEFMIEDPRKLLVSGNYNKVPIMLGYNKDEAMTFEGVPNICSWTTDLLLGNTTDLEYGIAPLLKLEKGSPKCRAICEKLENFYYKGENKVDKFMFPSDFHFIIGIIECAKIHAKASQYPVYLYQVSLDAGLNLEKIMFGLEHYPGTSHADELGYLFKSEYSDSRMGEKEEIAVRQFVKLWTNFAKYGNPTPKDNDMNVTWKPVESETINFLDIGEKLVEGVNPFSERMKLWQEVLQLSPYIKVVLTSR